MMPGIGRRWWLALVAASSAIAGAAHVQAAEPSEGDFYKGKTLHLVVGYNAGGGYDIYGRVFAEFFSNYLPGHPTIVTQNMPGAGSFVAAKYLYGVAPKDGTYFACVSQTLALDAAMNEDVKSFDPSKLRYLGRLLDNVDVGAGLPDAKFKTFEDVRTTTVAVGATGGASPGFLVPAALKQFAGAHFNIISGYGGSAEVYLAAERHEVDVMGSVGLTFLLQKHPDWVHERKMPIIYQTAVKRHPLLQHVPAIGELGNTPEGTAALRAIATSSEIGRSILTTPGVPDARVDFLRGAFQKMMADPAFLAVMEKRSIPVYGATGEELDQLTREVARTPPATLALIKSLLKN